MRWLALSVVVVVGCTKPNPNRCCTDEADCLAKNIPVGQRCDEGLLCRGNQCIAQPCSSPSECDPAAPYCAADLCAEQCTDDPQCPGFGQSGVPFCVSGICVACRDTNDCTTAAPVCEMGACRACAAHSECDSGLCDADGTCIPESTIAYVTQSGSATSSCTKADPCTYARALVVVDSTRPNVRLENVNDAGRRSYLTTKAIDLVLYGIGTVNIGGLTTTTLGTRKLRDLTVEGVECSQGDPVTPRSAVDLLRVTSTFGLYASRCNVTLERTRILQALDSNGIELHGSNDGSTLVMTHSELQGGGPGIYATDASQVQISNSVIRGQGSTGFIVYTSGVVGNSVSFTTFYNTFWNCADGPLAFTSTNNIFLNENAGAPANTVTGTQCRHTYSMMKPQSAAPSGTDNQLNMDPRFVNGAAGDFHLLAGSPAIDAADPAATESTDHDGTPRPQGASRDIGAFEYKP